MANEIKAALAVATADFDEDGIPDQVAAYPAPGGGLLVLHRSRSDSPAIPVAAAPDFVGAGDFNADGHFDLVFAPRRGRSLFYLPGDGTGSFGSPVEVPLPGALTAMAVGDVNRRDGLADVVAVVQDGAGSTLLVYESPSGALHADPEAVALPADSTAVAVADLDGDSQVDIAVTAGGRLMLVRGRDRRLSWDDASRSQVAPPEVVEAPSSMDREVHSKSEAVSRALRGGLIR